MDQVTVDVICVNVPVQTSEDKTLIKVLRVENGRNVDRNDAGFLQDSGRDKSCIIQNEKLTKLEALIG